MKLKLLDYLNEVFKGTDLSKTLVIACQHLLGTQYEMFNRLFQLGLQPNNCFLMGKNYSTNSTVYTELRKKGCFVGESSVKYNPEVKFDHWFSEELKLFLSKVLKRVDFNNFDKIVVLDDGGLLTSEIIDLDLPFEKFQGIEQTSSGWAKLKDVQTPFNIFYVARTYVKLKVETPYISKLCYERIVDHINTRELANPNILIIGSKGYIGQSLEGRFRDANFEVTGFDLKQGKLSNQGHIELGSFDVIIGTTGSQSISMNEVMLMKNNVSLISTSSSDREFPSELFRMPNTKLHQNHYLDGRCLVNSGFPITFYGNYHELPPEEIEITCSLLMLGICYYSIPKNDERCGNQLLSILMNRLYTMYLE